MGRRHREDCAKCTARDKAIGRCPLRRRAYLLDIGPPAPHRQPRRRWKQKPPAEKSKPKQRATLPSRELEFQFQPVARPRRLAVVQAPARPKPTGDCRTCQLKPTCHVACAEMGLPPEEETSFREVATLPNVADFLASVRANDTEEDEESLARTDEWDAKWSSIVAEQRLPLEEAIEHDLTPAQRDLARSFLAGKRPIDVARERRVSKPTISIMKRRMIRRLTTSLLHRQLPLLHS